MTDQDYSHRFHGAVASAFAASDSKVRQAYLDLAEFCRSKLGSGANTHASPEVLRRILEERLPGAGLTSGQTGGEAADEAHNGLSVDAAAERQLRQITRTRAMRSKFFDEGLFADPAWDILLALYQAEINQRRVTISSCCLAANVPATTALRHIGTLCEKGLVVRVPDPLDGRRSFLELSREASESMRRVLDAHEKLAA